MGGRGCISQVLKVLTLTIALQCALITSLKLSESDTIQKYNFKVPPQGVRQGRQDDGDDGDDGDGDGDGAGGAQGIGGLAGFIMGGNAVLSSLGQAFVPQLVTTLTQVYGAVNLGLNGTDTPNVPSFLVKQGQNLIAALEAAQERERERDPDPAPVASAPARPSLGIPGLSGISRLPGLAGISEIPGVSGISGNLPSLPFLQRPTPQPTHNENLLASGHFHPENYHPNEINKPSQPLYSPQRPEAGRPHYQPGSQHLPEQEVSHAGVQNHRPPPYYESESVPQAVTESHIQYPPPLNLGKIPPSKGMSLNQVYKYFTQLNSGTAPKLPPKGQLEPESTAHLAPISYPEEVNSEVFSPTYAPVPTAITERSTPPSFVYVPSASYLNEGHFEEGHGPVQNTYVPPSPPPGPSGYIPAVSYFHEGDTTKVGPQTSVQDTFNGITNKSPFSQVGGVLLEAPRLKPPVLPVKPLRNFYSTGGTTRPSYPPSPPSIIKVTPHYQYTKPSESFNTAPETSKPFNSVSGASLEASRLKPPTATGPLGEVGVNKPLRNFYPTTGTTRPSFSPSPPSVIKVTPPYQYTEPIKIETSRPFNSESGIPHDAPKLKPPTEAVAGNKPLRSFYPTRFPLRPSSSVPILEVTPAPHYQQHYYPAEATQTPPRNPVRHSLTPSPPPAIEVSPPYEPPETLRTTPRIFKPRTVSSTQKYSLNGASQKLKLTSLGTYVAHAAGNRMKPPGKPVYWMNRYYPNGIPVLTRRFDENDLEHHGHRRRKPVPAVFTETSTLESTVAAPTEVEDIQLASIVDI